MGVFFYWGADGSETGFIKRVLLGALGWYVVFTFFYFATVYAGIPHYTYNNSLRIIQDEFWVELIFTYHGNALFSCIYLPSVVCASFVAVVLIEGRKCSFKEIITATLSWLWWMIAIAFAIVLLLEESVFNSLLFPLVTISDITYEDLLLHIRHYGIYELIIAVPTAILGAFTYCGLRAWFSRNNLQTLKERINV